MNQEEIYKLAIKQINEGMTDDQIIEHWCNFPDFNECAFRGQLKHLRWHAISKTCPTCNGSGRVDKMNKDKQCAIIACETNLLPTSKEAKALLDISKFIKKQPIKTRLVLKLGSVDDWIDGEILSKK